MADSNTEFEYGSPSLRGNGFQDLTYRRQSEARRSRGAYIGGHETDFLMASIVPSLQDPDHGSSSILLPEASDDDIHNNTSLSNSARMSGCQSPVSGIGKLIDVTHRRGASSVVNMQQQQQGESNVFKALLEQLPILDHVTKITKLRAGEGGAVGAAAENHQGEYGACAGGAGNDDGDDAHGSEDVFQSMKSEKQRSKPAGLKNKKQKQYSLLEQIPAIAIASLLNLMMAIPFGVSYFPIGWSAGEASTVRGGTNTNSSEDEVQGSFPLPGKEALGIRMCLFSTLIGQIVMTFASKFDNPICFQMIENVPFFHTLATITIASQGYGIESLSTLFFLFGLSSAIVGVFFYLLGRLDLGKIVYFFPNHVLVGCIGGIGVFITISAIEVTNNVSFSFDLDGIKGIIDNMHLFGVVLLFEGTLRVLMWTTKSRVPLLAPIFFCSIPFVFYGALWLLQVDLDMAKDAGYFFPASSDDGEDTTNQSIWSRAFSVHTIDLLRLVDFRTISWKAVGDSFGTMVALAAFSLIHVPINIPAFSISMDIDTDMNSELMAHGYSNLVAGVFGGLPNYMTYSSSLLYAKSNGGGKVGSLLVAFFTFLFFIFGPELATFIPRCMAGTLLLHVGLDLFLEGVVDSYGSYDRLEYAGIWLITVTMTALGMTAGLTAGVFAALSVYAAQSIAYINPIREIMAATTLRSSVWTRPAKEMAILNDEQTGRSRVLVVLLQGHLFFGNINQLTDTVTEMLSKNQGTGHAPLIVILDFSLVLGLDSSAAHAVAKINAKWHRRFNVAATVFVAGSEGFPCEYSLSAALSKHPDGGGNIEELEGLTGSLASIGDPSYHRNRVCDNLDEALIFAEDVLIVRQDATLLKRDRDVVEPAGYLVPEDERRLAAQQLANLFPQNDEVTSVVKLLFSFFEREEYSAKQIIWKQGSESDCAKLLVRGECIAYSNGGRSTSMAAERVPTGNIIGELGLVQRLPRLSTVECTSDKAILYSLSLQSWENIKRNHTFAALYFEEIVIRYLAQRVQHVTNRIFDESSRCLPV